jgi:hypothetical protein
VLIEGLQPKPIDYSARKIIGNIITPSIKDVRAHELVRNTPSPTRSPYSINQIASTVINVPKVEIDHFLKTVVKRYVRTIKKESLTFFTRPTDFISTSDSDFEYLLTHSLFSRFINPELDAIDISTFQNQLSADDSFYKIDIGHLDQMEPLNGFYYCNTKTLLLRTDNGVKLQAIKIKDLVITPNDNDWERAKLFVIQGLCMSVLICDHPKRHFPMDAINGLTKTLIPKKHIIHRLLTPHMYMQLPLNFAVLYVNKSVAHNDQNELYTCFPCSKEGFITSLKASYAGLKDNSSYKKYQFLMAPEKIPFEFGEFLERYWYCIYNFVEKICKNIPINDEVTTHWANDVSHFVPGFPNGEEIWKEDNLVRALTSFIHTVSFSHSSDHYSYSQTNINQVPSRIRVKPPSSKYRNIPLDKSKIFKRTDLHRHHLAMEMYFTPSNLVTVLDAKYSTVNADESLAVEEFKDDLSYIEENLTTLNYIPLNEVATSIQY